MTQLEKRKIRVARDVRNIAKRRARNRAIKSNVNTYIKKILTPFKQKRREEFSAEVKEQLKSDFILLTKHIDTAARKGVIHPNYAARKKSRLAKKINAVVS